jgi:hypothetical protein
MRHIKAWSDLTDITDIPIRHLLEQRREQLAEFGEPADLGGFYIIEPGDTLPAIEQSIGFPIATRFPDPAFVPTWEWIENHGTFWEAPFVLCDDGSGFLLLVPDRPDIDAELLALMRAYAP